MRGVLERRARVVNLREGEVGRRRAGRSASRCTRARRRVRRCRGIRTRTSGRREAFERRASIEPPAAGVQRSSIEELPIVPIHTPEIHATCAMVACALWMAGAWVPSVGRCACRRWRSCVAPSGRPVRAVTSIAQCVRRLQPERGLDVHLDGLAVWRDGADHRDRDGPSIPCRRPGRARVRLAQAARHPARHFRFRRERT